jgi:uncharacterized membrane protein YesL
MKAISSNILFWALLILFILVIVQLALLKGWEIKLLFDEKPLRIAFQILLFIKILYGVYVLVSQHRLKNEDKEK